MMYRLFSWELSYFSGKARAYLRYKERMGDLETASGSGFEDVLATLATAGSYASAAPGEILVGRKVANSAFARAHHVHGPEG